MAGTGQGDDQTLAVYTRDAAAYADCAAQELARPWLARFASMVTPGGRVLDFGCGPGWAADYLNAQGFRVECFDGSEGLAAEAKRRYGLDVKVGRFDEFAAPLAHFDGIWCSFALLHDTREALPAHLTRLAAALAPGGAFYLGLKEGTGAERDSLGRLYTYFGQEEVSQLIEGTGFSKPEIETELSKGFSGEPCTAMHFFARRA
ncbi:MAG: class I SAM-dependent methyltransferase [Pseudomonadota bacterium]